MDTAPEGPVLLTLTQGGRRLAEKIAPACNGEVVFCPGTLRQTVQDLWPEREQLVFIMATGIVVRVIAPLLGDKYRDPAVVVCDEQGRFAVSLLSGHIGGGNALAEKIAACSGGTAVITTASDVLGKTALDLWAREHNLTPGDRTAMTRAMGKLVNSGRVLLYGPAPPGLPGDIVPTDERDRADLVITVESECRGDEVLLHPRALVAGIGCNRNTPKAHIERALEGTCRRHGLAIASIRNLASIDVKNDEPGLLDYARDRGWTIDFFDRDRLNGVGNVSRSEAVIRAVGAQGVAEPAALLSARATTLRVRKEKWTDVTVAIAEAPLPWWEPDRDQPNT